MTQQGDSQKLAIQRPTSIVPVSPSWLTIWKPRRVLPVAGAAALLWLGKRAASALLPRRKTPETPPIRIPWRKQQLPPEKTPSRRRSVIYRYSARWSVTVRGDRE